MEIDLQQKKILVTREKKQAELFAEKIEQANGKAMIVDALKIDCLCPQIENIAGYEWLFFTSANGVSCFFERFRDHLQGHKLAVVGPKTNEVLHEFGYTADFMPSIFNAQTMAAEFLAEYGSHQTVLLVRGTLASPVLVDAFHKAGVYFTCLEVYQTVINETNTEKLNKIVDQKQLDFITFTSPSTVDAFVHMVHDLSAARRSVAVCIGTTTEKRAKEQGYSKRLVPDHFTIEGMMLVMHDYLKRGAV
jgi:uroporphyrinogen-III synthase